MAVSKPSEPANSQCPHLSGDPQQDTQLGGGRQLTKWLLVGAQELADSCGALQTPSLQGHPDTHPLRESGLEL